MGHLFLEMHCGRDTCAVWVFCQAGWLAVVQKFVIVVV
jgi:hypothetical protein